MNGLISQITVLALVGIISFAVLAVFGVLPKNFNLTKNGYEGKGELKIGQKKYEPYGKTQIIPVMVVEQLDERGRVENKYDLLEIPEEGVLIGRSPECMIQIPDSKNNVGRYHAIIGKDKQGIFIQDNNSKNGIFNVNKKRVKQLDVNEGTECYLANVKIRFKPINPFEKCESSMQGETMRYEGRVKGKVQRI